MAGADIPVRLRLAGIALRTVFIVSLVIMTMHLSMPESSSIWTVYDEPTDLLRLSLGLLVCLWLTYQLFAVPLDSHAHRTWLYLGLAAVPFALICIVGTW
jgi:hypothetical protein